MKNKNGFTLVEILAVIAVISILSIILVPNVVSYINKSNEEYIKKEETEIKEAASIWKDDHCDNAIDGGGSCSVSYTSGVSEETILDVKDKLTEEILNNDTDNIDNYKNRKYVCVSTLYNKGLIDEIKYKGETCNGIVLYDENGKNPHTYVKCGEYKTSTTSGSDTYVFEYIDKGLFSECFNNSVEEKIAITFDLNGGTYNGSSNSISVEINKGGSLNDSDFITLDGNNFGGWYKDNGIFSNRVTNVTTFNEDTTIYAKWLDDNENENETSTYTIKFDPNGGTISDSESSRNLKEGEAYGTLPIPTYDGYTFIGWFTSASSGAQVSDKTIMGASNVILYAQWKKLYKLTFDPNGGNISDSESSKNLEEGEAYGTLPTPTYDGYTFIGWFTSASSGVQVSNETTMGTSNVTLYAHYEEAYNLEFCYTGKFQVSVDVEYKKNSSYTTAKAYKVLNNTCIRTTQDDWVVWFLTKGTLTNDVKLNFYAFLVGGGQGGYNGSSKNSYGGAGGYTTTSSTMITLDANSSSSLEIGAGGSSNGGSGNPTTAFGLTAKGGSSKNNGTGFGGTPATCNGFANGGLAGRGVYAFGDSNIDGIMYGAGGAGGACTNYTSNNNNPVDSRSGRRSLGDNGGGYSNYGDGSSGESYTGGGGAGGYYNYTDSAENMSKKGGTGGSGIVIIQSQRNININGTDIATYTGGYEVFTSNGKNYIMLKSTGVLKMNTDVNISAFLVGGGQAGYDANNDHVYGGGGGYTTTSTSTISLTSGTSYNITIGEGGRRNGDDGETTTAFGLTASGGKYRSKGNGANGTPANCSNWTYGTAGGDGSYAFGDKNVDGIRYGAGGSGGGCTDYTSNSNNPVDSRIGYAGRTGGGYTEYPGSLNTGSGGGGGYSYGTANGESPGGQGGSGVIILRIEE